MLPDCDVALVNGAEAEEPVDLYTAKLQCRRVGEYTREDTWFWQAIAAARATVEAETGRQLRTATTWTVKLRGFPCQAIVLPVAPLLSVSSVAYLDTAGAAQTLTEDDDYLVVVPAGDRAGYGRVERPYGVTWPTTRCQAGGVTVTLTAGYASPPTALTQAMLLLIGHWYTHRESVSLGSVGTEVALTFEALVRPYRLYPLPVLV